MRTLKRIALAVMVMTLALCGASYGAWMVIEEMEPDREED
jgi:hypothetical protein